MVQRQPRARASTYAVTEKILARDPLDEIRRAFRLFDDDGTGRISLRNLKRVAKELGENLDEEELCVRAGSCLVPPRSVGARTQREEADDPSCNAHARTQTSNDRGV